jgi:chromosome segregation ATPase
LTEDYKDTSDVDLEAKFSLPAKMTPEEMENELETSLASSPQAREMESLTIKLSYESPNSTLRIRRLTSTEERNVSMKLELKTVTEKRANDLKTRLQNKLKTRLRIQEVMLKETKRVSKALEDAKKSLTAVTKRLEGINERLVKLEKKIDERQNELDNLEQSIVETQRKFNQLKLELERAQGIKLTFFFILIP